MKQGYKGLKVYEESYATALAMYRETASMPKEETYGLISQIKRAATSIPLNIAEGYGKRENENEFRRFLLMAIGSCDEMKVLLDFCKDLGYLANDKYQRYTQTYNEIGRMLNGLREKWKSN
jgi:four helix bundle protein